MTLGEWISENLRRVGFDETYTTVAKTTGTNVTVTARRIDIDVSIALVSTSSKEEFANLAKTLIEEQSNDEVSDFISDEQYGTLLSKAKMALAGKLMTTNNRMYRKWMEILERRDSDNWAMKKNVKADVQSNGNQPISISFQVV